MGHAEQERGGTGAVGIEREITDYLRDNIPLARAMHLKVLSIDETGARLSAPFEPNVNHRKTIFGGSIAALAILSAWALVHARLKLLGLSSRLVIQQQSVDYLQPAEGDFVAFCSAPSAETWERFVMTLRRRGRARINLNAELSCGEKCIARFTGSYVALRGQAADVF